MSSSKHRGNNNKSRKGGGTSVDAVIVSSHHSGAKGDILMPMTDLRRRQPSWVLTQNPPKNFLTLPVWIQISQTFNIAISNSVYTEQNFVSNISSYANYASFLAAYDQYCMYSVHVRINMQNTAGSAAESGYGRINTAIDYDSISNVGTEAGIQAFGNCVTSEFVPGKSYERYFKPTVAANVAGGLAVERAWVNSASTINHYGFRSFFNNNTVAGTTADYNITAVIGLRNNF